MLINLFLEYYDQQVNGMSPDPLLWETLFHPILNRKRNKISYDGSKCFSHWLDLILVNVIFEKLAPPLIRWAPHLYWIWTICPLFVPSLTFYLLRRLLWVVQRVIGAQASRWCGPLCGQVWYCLLIYGCHQTNKSPINNGSSALLFVIVKGQEPRCKNRPKSNRTCQNREEKGLLNWDHEFRIKNKASVEYKQFCGGHPSFPCKLQLTQISFRLDWHPPMYLRCGPSNSCWSDGHLTWFTFLVWSWWTHCNVKHHPVRVGVQNATSLLWSKSVSNGPMVVFFFFLGWDLGPPFGLKCPWVHLVLSGPLDNWTWLPNHGPHLLSNF